jgi:hypothetical protein
MKIEAKEDLDRLIENEIEESLILDYKSAESIARSDGKKREITKDVSALANSTGGTLIYGIKEFDQKEKSHLPERLDPIDIQQFSKEWLDQICGLIQPRIEGLLIKPIPIGPNATDYALVVEVPKSGTAHQALDRRYYKRRNFESSPMEDYEVRDIMNRGKHPKLSVTCKVVLMPNPTRKSRIVFRITNESRSFARFYKVRVYFPFKLANGTLISPEDAFIDRERGESSWLFSISNVGVGPPIFPGDTVTKWIEFDQIRDLNPMPENPASEILIQVFADEMPSFEEVKSLDNIENEWK